MATLDPERMRGERVLLEWLRSGGYLPPFLRDFHDQKDFFKSIHLRLDRRAKAEPGFTVKPDSWIDAHIYTIDAFLWFMARCGWTLQRSRKRLEFTDVYEFRETFRREWHHPWSEDPANSQPKSEEAEK